MTNTPARILRAHLGLNIVEMAAESGISRPTIYKLEAGAGCGATVWKKLRSRWPREIRASGLTADDFLSGEILAPGAISRAG